MFDISTHQSSSWHIVIIQQLLTIHVNQAYHTTIIIALSSLQINSLLISLLSSPKFFSIWVLLPLIVLVRGLPESLSVFFHLCLWVRLKTETCVLRVCGSHYQLPYPCCSSVLSWVMYFSSGGNYRLSFAFWNLVITVMFPFFRDDLFPVSQYIIKAVRCLATCFLDHLLKRLPVGEPRDTSSFPCDDEKLLFWPESHCLSLGHFGFSQVFSKTLSAILVSFLQNKQIPMSRQKH